MVLDKENKKFGLKLSSTFISNQEVDLGVVKNVNCVVGVPNMSYSDQDPLLDNRDVQSTIEMFAGFLKTMEDKHKDTNKQNQLLVHN